ncbi:MAG TPA: NADH-quinone oxidoreductase subunit F, partial [Clostridiales bacterium]|nr:NADH-quinone oxidoreductase subunit F [Clostridiales bacterium]
MLKTRDDLIALRKACMEAAAKETQKILICAGTGCIAGGSLAIYQRFQELMAEKGIPCSVELDNTPHQHVGLKRSGCHGFCEMGVLVRIEPQGWLYTKVKLEDCEEILEKTILKGEHIPRLAYTKNDIIFKKQEDIPFYSRQTRLVLEHCGHIDATSIREYLAVGGYSALEKVLFEMTGEEVIQEISNSNLRGR